MQKDRGSLKVTSAPVDEWILHTPNAESFDYNTEAWVREAISKGMKRHQNAKCFNSSGIGHLRRDCRQGISGNNISSGNDKIEGLNLLDYVEDASKANIEPINVDQ